MTKDAKIKELYILIEVILLQIKLDLEHPEEFKDTQDQHQCILNRIKEFNDVD